MIKYKNKKEKGITLVALVITMVVHYVECWNVFISVGLKIAFKFVYPYKFYQAMNFYSLEKKFDWKNYKERKENWLWII